MNRALQSTLSAFCFGTLWLVAPATTFAQPSASPIDFGTVQYERKATRLATERFMLGRLLSEPLVEFGPWHLLTAFEGSELGMLEKPWPPEQELENMKPGGPGPDLSRTWQGRDGDIQWRELGYITNRPINMKVFPTEAENENGTSYLYCTATVARDRSIRVSMGSDDGLRFWCNGQLLVDKDAPRGLDAEAHQVDLVLQEGVNHIFAKITQGKGGWDYQMNTKLPIDPIDDSKLQAQLDLDFPGAEDPYYRKVTVPVPTDIVLEVGGLDCLPDGRAAVCTRRGDVYLIDAANADWPFEATYTLFASGLHEPLGLEARIEDGHLVVYCVQRAELTKLVDTDDDGHADIYQSFCDDWGVSGNYHEFAFGPKFDAEGNAWVTLNVGFCGSLGKSIAKWRGWALKITPDGKAIPVCDGLRSPNGIGFLPTGEAFYVDNQGDFVGTCKMQLLAHDEYIGHPAGLHWREGLEGFTRDPERSPANIWFPYKKMGQSTADIALDDTNGKFGPFAGQLFCGDQTLSTVMRVALEQVDGHWQGACFPFREDLDCGVNRVAFDGDGNMWVGQTDRGWGSVGRRRYGVQKVIWTGKMPFEVRTMTAAPNGFVLEFTRDIDSATATNTASYEMLSYTYEYHREYGSDEMETQPVNITAARVLDNRRVLIEIDNRRSGGEGFVYELKSHGVRDADGNPLLHEMAFYSLLKWPAQSVGAR